MPISDLHLQSNLKFQFHFFDRLYCLYNIQFVYFIRDLFNNTYLAVSILKLFI